MAKGRGRRKSKSAGKRSKATPSVETQPDLSVDEVRRVVLKRLGAFAAYTAPAILSMSWSDKAAAVVVDSTDTG
jgi:hypothetical protein